MYCAMHILVLKLRNTLVVLLVKIRVDKVSKSEMFLKQSLIYKASNISYLDDAINVTMDSQGSIKRLILSLVPFSWYHTTV